MNDINALINAENWLRFDQERNVIFPSMFLDLNSITLKRIDNRHKDRNNHESNNIKDGHHYLVGYNGHWLISKAKRSYYLNGWEFNLGSHYAGLRSLDFIFEIENLPEYNPEPLGRLKYVNDPLDECYDIDEE